MINQILFSASLNFKCTTHDRTLYSTVYKGHKNLLLRQFDDFAMGTPSEDLAKEIYDIIGRRFILVP